MPEPDGDSLAAIPFLKRDANGDPHLVGSHCTHCKAVVPGERSVCAACGARESIEAIRLSSRGRLLSFTVVHRSFPGVKTPFVSAIVQLTEGAIIKGTLLDTSTRPEDIPNDLPVDVVYRDTGQRSAEGKRFLSYFFVPAADGSS